MKTTRLIREYISCIPMQRLVLLLLLSFFVACTGLISCKKSDPSSPGTNTLPNAPSEENENKPLTLKRLDENGNRIELTNDKTAEPPQDEQKEDSDNEQSEEGSGGTTQPNEGTQDGENNGPASTPSEDQTGEKSGNTSLPADELDKKAEKESIDKKKAEKESVTDKHKTPDDKKEEESSSIVPMLGILLFLLGVLTLWLFRNNLFSSPQEVPATDFENDFQSRSSFYSSNTVNDSTDFHPTYDSKQTTAQTSTQAEVIMPVEVAEKPKPPVDMQAVSAFWQLAGASVIGKAHIDH